MDGPLHSTERALNGPTRKGLHFSRRSFAFVISPTAIGLCALQLKRSYIFGEFCAIGSVPARHSSSSISIPFSIVSFPAAPSLGQPFFGARIQWNRPICNTFSVGEQWRTKEVRYTILFTVAFSSGPSISCTKIERKKNAKFSN